MIRSLFLASLLAFPATAEQRQFANIVYDVPEGWSVERKLVGGKSHLVVCGQGLTAVWS